MITLKKMEKLYRQAKKYEDKPYMIKISRQYPLIAALALCESSGKLTFEVGKQKYILKKVRGKK